MAAFSQAKVGLVQVKLLIEQLARAKADAGHRRFQSRIHILSLGLQALQTALLAKEPLAQRVMVF